MNNIRKIRVIPAVLILIFSLAASGCGRSDGGSEVLASIGDTKITVGDFNERISNLPARYQDMVRARKEEFLQELINDTLLYQEAMRKKIQKKKDVGKLIEEAKKKILVSRLLKDEVDDTISITDEDVSVFYEANSDKYMTPEVMRVSHILLLSREDAENVHKEIKNGAPFSDLARAKSVDPTAQRGGDIGYFPKGQLMPEFEKACSELSVGQTSGVVKTKLGYHLIKLTDRRKPEVRPLEQVKNNIRSQLKAIKRRELFNEMLGRLRKETRIEVNKEALSENGDKKKEAVKTE